MAIVRMQQRRDTALNWSTYNPVLRQGELGFDTNARKFKIGDGETDWNGLDYLLEEEVEAALAAQVAAEAAQAAAESAAESVIPSTDAAMTAIDADPDSDFRVQSDARQSASYALAGTDSTQRLLSALHAEFADQTVLFVGDSTGNETTEWIYLLTQALAAQWPRWTVQYRLWNDGATSYDAPVTIQAGTGSRTLTIYNASVAGFATYSWLGPRADTALFALDPVLAVVSLGHNEGTSSALWHGQYVALTETLTERLPGADVLLIGQNPESANTYQQQRREMYREIAARRGFGFIDVCQAFLDTDPTLASLLADGIHPNATGSALWRDTVLPAFVRSPRMAPRPQIPSSLTQAGEDLLVNGNFAAFTGALPTGWDNSGGTTTAAKNTTYYESANGYSVEVTSVASGDLMRQILPINRVKGRWITLAVKERVATGQANTAGRIAIADSTGSTASASSDVRDGFRWLVVTRFIPATATFARVYLYGDSAGGGGKALFDVATCVLGKFPRRAAVGPAGAQGPAGTPTGVFARKTANETRVDNTRADDSELKVALAANKVYRFDAAFFYSNASNTPDIKFRFNVPAGATLLMAEQVLTSGATSVAGSIVAEGLAAGVDSIAGAGFTSAVVNARFTGIVVMGSTAGNLQIQWAQNVTDAANGTTLYANSFIHALEVA